MRKTHNSGKKHKDNVRAYYQEWYDKNYQTLVERGMRVYLSWCASWLVATTLLSGDGPLGLLPLFVISAYTNAESVCRRA